IIAINEALEEAPELVNLEPYNNGWIIELKPDDPDEINTFMSSNEYLEMLEGGE
ncbi:MAG: glycine cleavage system protein H, partial [Syntrophobacterales bacterium]|nr:glycine cleavage system protein H [Syntrophobacterales bacterium]